MTPLPAFPQIPGCGCDNLDFRPVYTTLETRRKGEDKARILTIVSLIFQNDVESVNNSRNVLQSGQRLVEDEVQHLRRFVRTYTKNGQQNVDT